MGRSHDSSDQISLMCSMGGMILKSSYLLFGSLTHVDIQTENMTSVIVNDQKQTFNLIAMQLQFLFKAVNANIGSTNSVERDVQKPLSILENACDSV